ncbi:hypothetical protein [Nocardia sp. NPDC049526]|uniref:hypothetical protein n=1 Tax=Nocardia sp. NPDC049526 TaxID=3364316 RepID=UPI00378790DE
MSNAAMRLLLWFLGQCIAQGSRFMPSVRSQITRSLTFEMSAGDRVARHWIFDTQLRRATSHSGHAAAADCVVHIGSSRQALRILSSPRAVDKLVEANHQGTVEIHGSAFVLLWFFGLTRKFIKIGRASGPRHRIPDAYIAHDPAASGDETILIEPAVVRLDPEWKAAWKARSTLWMVRGTTDEPMPEP